MPVALGKVGVDRLVAVERVVQLCNRLPGPCELGLEPGSPATAVVKATTVIVETPLPRT